MNIIWEPREYTIEELRALCPRTTTRGHPDRLIQAMKNYVKSKLLSGGSRSFDSPLPEGQLDWTKEQLLEMLPQKTYRCRMFRKTPITPEQLSIIKSDPFKEIISFNHRWKEGFKRTYIKRRDRVHL